MAPKDYPAPARIFPDAIVEALFEVRFDSEGLPETISSRLLTCSKWSQFEKTRLPAFEIPQRIRELDPNLRYQPTHQINAEGGLRIRIGDRVLSCHRPQPYPGWRTFKPQLNDAMGELASAAAGARIRRAGLRYLNAIDSRAHKIQSFADLDLSLSRASEPVLTDINVNIRDAGPSGLLCTTRVATRSFIHPAPADTVIAFIDIDVYQEFGSERQVDAAFLSDWIEPAHQFEKQNFFRLIRREDLERLKENC